MRKGIDFRRFGRANVAAEADEQVAELRITSLETRITEQRQQIAELEEKLLAASTKAQDLAVKAIEGTSRQSA